MAENKRPVSPHLQVYKPQITSMMSIFHRITGFGLTFALPVFTWWMLELAFGETNFQLMEDILRSWFGVVLMAGFIFALFYHFFNGIRHLAWDIGFGFEMDQVKKSGYTVIFLSSALTFMTLVCLLVRDFWPQYTHFVAPFFGG